MARSLYTIVSLRDIPSGEYGSETLALFDIDGTLVTPQHRIMRRQNHDAKLEFVRQDKPDRPDLVRCWRQQEPARKLPSLTRIPIVIIAGEASYHAAYDHCTAAYLEQAGAHPTFIRLADQGVRGNGHMMMIEKNNTAIAGVIAQWLERQRLGDRRAGR